MDLKEAKEILQQLNDGYSFSACRVCQNYNEQTQKCDKEKCDELVAIDRVLQELDNLQKENDEIKNVSKEIILETGKIISILQDLLKEE